MATESEKPNIYSQGEQIDLVDVLIRLVDIVRKRIIWLILFFCLGAGFGTIGYFTFEPTYTTRMLVESKVVAYGDIASLLETLKALIEEGNTSLLAQKLNLEEEQAESFDNIDVINITEKEIGRAEKENIKDFRYIIQVEVNQTAILPDLQKGLLEYMANNEFIKQRTADQKEVLDLSIQRLEKEIAQIDSIKQSIQRIIATNNNQNLFLPDLGKLYEQGVMLYEKELLLKSRLKFVEQFQVLEGFTLFKEPSSFNLVKSIVAGMASGFLIWVIFVIILELRQVIVNAAED